MKFINRGMFKTAVSVVLIAASCFAYASRAEAQTYILGGYLPDENSGNYVKAYLLIKDLRIRSVSSSIPSEDVDFFLDTEDAIYPSLINLHNHTKQNVLPLWKEARGQFANRFEWRTWGPYKEVVSENMNPWIQEKRAKCAAFRFSELRAMVGGTSHLQGPSSCVSDFGIYRVEDSGAFHNDKFAVQASTDLLYPDLLGKFFYPEIFPTMNPAEWINWMNGYDGPPPPISYLEAFNDWKKKNPDRIKRIKRYIDFQHRSIESKTEFLADPRRSAVITHISEGRRNDPYNRYEFDLLVQLGMDQPGMSVVHGVGITAEEFRHMAERRMGLIWSPFSNLLLYGETARIEEAKAAGVTIALGSDWAPTGSRNVLEELKIARAYLQRSGLNRIFSDQDLVRMVTENPAKILNAFDQVGSIQEGKVANLILVSKQNPNAYSNLVEAGVRDIQLLFVDGKPLYGNPGYLAETGVVDQEMLTTKEDGCGVDKAWRAQKSPDGTELNLDGYREIQSVIFHAMSQRRNLREAEGTDSRYLVDPPKLYSCEDPDYEESIEDFLAGDFLLNESEWIERRTEYSLSGRTPEKLAEYFNLTEGR